jgi:hypothetical protein
MPAIRAIPSAIPCEATDMNDIESGVNAILEQVIEAMVRPLTAEERSPRSKELEKYSRIVFKGA